MRPANSGTFGTKANESCGAEGNYFNQNVRDCGEQAFDAGLGTCDFPDAKKQRLPLPVRAGTLSEKSGCGHIEQKNCRKL